MAFLNWNRYLVRRQRNGDKPKDWWLVNCKSVKKSGEYAMPIKLTFNPPPGLIGKKIKFKVEVVEDDRKK